MSTSPPRYNIGIVGATGAVGRELLQLIGERQFPLSDDLRLFAGERSRGTSLAWSTPEGTVRHAIVRTLPAAENTQGLAQAFGGLDVIFFSAGAAVSRLYAPLAVQHGGPSAVVIDNSSAFRMTPGVPLVVPEVNGDLLRCGPTGGDRGGAAVRKTGPLSRIIANPNCSTILMLLAVNPLHQRFGVRRLVISTYQAVSGAGARGMQALEHETRGWLAEADGAGADRSNIRAPQPQFFPEPCAFNIFSHDSAVDPETGYNIEERKMRDEALRIWNEGLVDARSAASSASVSVSPNEVRRGIDRRRPFTGGITATCIRVPVMRAHAESVNITFEVPVTVDEVRSVLEEAPGVQVIDDRSANTFPTSHKASGRADVLVGRIRGDWSQPADVGPHQAPDDAAEGRSGRFSTASSRRFHGVDLFLAGDQIRKGAALNALQIAEHLPR